MKNISPALQTMFNTVTQFIMVEIYTITLVSGQVLYYTSADIPIVWNGFTYVTGPKITRDSVKTILGVQVDTLDVTFFPEMTDLINGNLFLYEASVGVFDGAWFSCDRLFLTSYGATPTGSVNMFQGMTSAAVVGRTSCKFTISSPLDLLNVQMPRNVYQAGCQHNLFDVGCTLNSATYRIACTITAGSTNSDLYFTQVGGNRVLNFYQLGNVTFTSGINAGLSRSIYWDNGAGGVQLYYPLPNPPAVGDTFTMVPGCDKQQYTCSYKYGNLANFRGFPYVPVPETAV
jgi:uncharacterized phage protein (TIGR02218 family)